jgi:hypothetical protein
MSWGEPQQPPYDPNNPYGQQPQQPYDPNNPYGQQPQQPYPQQPQQPQGPGPQPGWGVPPQQPQPFGSGTGYPQQPYPQQPYDPNNPYAQQGYGQPEFAQYPAQPPKKGNGMLIGIVVGALVVVGGGITAALLLTGNHGGSTDASSTTGSTSSATSTSGDPTGTGTGSGSGTITLSAPASVDGLTKLTGSTADDAVSRMRSSLSSESEEYPDPVLGAYNDGGGKDVTTILVDEAMDKLSSADQKGLTSTGDAQSIVDEIMTGAGVDDAQPESTDADDGALSCGTKDESGTSVTICVWYDVKTFGTLQYLDGTAPDDAAPAADEIRAAAEG